MFNRNPRVTDAPVDAPADPEEYEQALRENFRSTLLAATAVQCSALVMPDAGCGIYMNDAKRVGRIFGEILRQEFWGTIEEVAICGKPEFQDAVHEAVHAQERSSAAALPAAAATPQVVWEYAVRDGGFEPFGRECQQSLECSYQNAMVGGPLQARLNSSGRDIVVDFGRMTQQIVGSDRTRKVRRCLTAAST